MEYDMQPFLRQCVESYCNLAGINQSSLKQVPTPFLDEAKGEKDSEAAISAKLDDIAGGNPKQLGYDEWCKRIEANAGANEKAESALEECALKSVAAKIMMKILYAARFARADLLRAVGALATYISKWTRLCDKKLLRLVSYINSSLELRMISWVSDSSDHLDLHDYSDADFGSDPSMKSTSGSFTHLIAKDGDGNITSFCQMSAVSKKQTCVSHSTPEAELVAGDLSIRSEGIPLLQALTALFKRNVIMQYFQDNETAAHCIRTGRTNALRHVGRTHRISISWLHEQTQGKDKTMILNNCKSEDMKADIFTKSFTDPVKWNQNLNIIYHVYPQSNWNQACKQRAGKPAAAAQVTNHERLLIEFCCGNNSRIGQKWKESKGCRVERITEEHDVTTEHGLQHTLDIIANCHGPNTVLVAAMPCTGGSPWQNFNKQFPRAREKIRNHIRVFKKIFASFLTCARALRAKGGHVVNEWPRFCSYWRLPMVRAAFELGIMYEAQVDGCSVGLVNSEGKPIKKPWTFKATSPTIISHLQSCKCPRDHEHAPCAGKETKRTEGYTDDLVRRLHAGFRDSIRKTSDKRKAIVTATEIHARKLVALPAILYAGRPAEGVNICNDISPSHNDVRAHSRVISQSIMHDVEHLTDSEGNLTADSAAAPRRFSEPNCNIPLPVSRISVASVASAMASSSAPSAPLAKAAGETSARTTGEAQASAAGATPAITMKPLPTTLVQGAGDLHLTSLAKVAFRLVENPDSELVSQADDCVGHMSAELLDIAVSNGNLCKALGVAKSDFGRIDKQAGQV
jgi:hypothetical protein